MIISPDNSRTKVAVLAGGIGSERDVSLQSGANIASALGSAGFDVITSDIGPDDLSILDDETIDVFFLALHGQFGEDGQLQEILENRRLRYTGSDARSSRIAFDKVASKRLFDKAGATTAAQVYLDKPQSRDKLTQRLTEMASKFVVKPVREGSSVGVSIIEGAPLAAQTALDCFQQYGPCMIEQFIDGREISIGILMGRALPVVEIRSKAVFYDYQAKYLDDTTDYLFDTIDDPAFVEKVSRTAEACFDEIGCRHLSRVDMIVAEDGLAYVLEINTLPGFTSHSLLPMAAGKAGISTPDLCAQIVHAAMQ